MALLRLERVSKRNQHGFFIKDFNLQQADGERIGIMGETGSGKTTLLKLIAGIEEADEGTILFNENPIEDPGRRLIPGHPGIGYLSQQYELWNNYYVHEIISYSTLSSIDEAAEITRLCRIDHLLKRRTDELSGGEKQRVALAKMLTNKPSLLLLDEPFSNLDAIHIQIIKEVLKDMQNTMKVNCIMVSHEADDMLGWADTIYIIKAGEIIQSGTPKNIYRHPVNEYCAAITGEYNVITPALLSLTAIKNNPLNEFLIARPEDILIGSHQENSFIVKVKEVQFCGHYTRLVTEIQDQQVIVYTQNNAINPGDNIHLSFRLHL